MSDRGMKTYRVDITFDPEWWYRIVRAKSEEEAIEKVKDEHGHEIFHNWIKFEVGEEETDD